MKEGDIVLIDLPQPGGGSKLRPALILKQLPKYNDFLVCGISTQIRTTAMKPVLNSCNSCLKIRV